MYTQNVFSNPVTLRKEIDVISHLDHITQHDTEKCIDIVKILLSTKLMDEYKYRKVEHWF